MLARAGLGLGVIPAAGSSRSSWFGGAPVPGGLAWYGHAQCAEDPDSFYEPWSGMRRYRRVEQRFVEDICAENNQHLFDYKIPVATKPDF